MSVVAFGAGETGDGRVDVRVFADDFFMAGDAGVADCFSAGEEAFIGPVGIVAFEAFSFGDGLVEVLFGPFVEVAVFAHCGVGAFIFELVFAGVFVLVTGGAGTDGGRTMQEFLAGLFGMATAECAVDHFDGRGDVGRCDFLGRGFGLGGRI